MCKIIHTFCKTTHFVQYQSSFLCVQIRKFYTWLKFFTQLAVVMVVTNIRCVWRVVCLFGENASIMVWPRGQQKTNKERSEHIFPTIFQMKRLDKNYWQLKVKWAQFWCWVGMLLKNAVCSDSWQFILRSRTSSWRSPTTKQGEPKSKSKIQD